MKLRTSAGASPERLRHDAMVNALEGDLPIQIAEIQKWPFARFLHGSLFTRSECVSWWFCLMLSFRPHDALTASSITYLPK